MHLNDIVDSKLLADMIAQKYVKVQSHPEYGYLIYNYTDHAMFDKVWNQATINCRGLITDASGVVIARGMPKFFNYQQDEAPKFYLRDQVDVADKADGSLGILYSTPDGGFAIATRGSFTSDQAVHATERLNANLSRYLPTLHTAQQRAETVLVEIVYPENRIVLDYGGEDALKFLGVVKTDAGIFFPVSPSAWPDGCTEAFGLMTYAEAIALPPRKNAEGLVLTRDWDGAMVKLKQQDYLDLHRIITGLSARSIWQLIVDGKDVDEYIEQLPDEFVDWAWDVVQDLESGIEYQGFAHGNSFEIVRANIDALYGEQGWGKKEFALEVMKSVPDESWAMFMLYDGKDLEPTLWKRAKPEAFITPVAQRTEDVA